MRPYPFAPLDNAPLPPEEPDELAWDAANAPYDRPSRGRLVRRWLVRGLAAFIVLFVAAVAWLTFTAPLSKSLEPPTPPSITLLAADGTPIARRGAIIGAPVDSTRLPAHVTDAFLAIEDRRFRSHWGVDPRGVARAVFHNVSSDGRSQGASTITQQLAKNAFLDSDRTYTRKLREVLIAFWLEAWLSKDQILSRYLSNVYFGDNVYGLTAAAKHYFDRTPQRLSVAQAAMLAGLVKAPSKLAPTSNLKGARERQKLVVAAMVDAGFLTRAEGADVSPARIVPDKTEQLPDGTYFADWVLPEAREAAGEIASESTVKTTLDRDLQKAAEKSVKRAGLKEAQIALVAMRPDGRVVAMVGGKDYAQSPFNRATQAKRQPGSAFKLFLYLAAMQKGYTPDTRFDDNPVTIADWSPKNVDGRYEGEITLRHAFAKSSNVVAARLIQDVGYNTVRRVAKELGVQSPLAQEASIALGTSGMSLLELTSAYASIAAGSYPVRPRGVEQERERGWLQSIAGGQRTYPKQVHDEMLDLLSASAEEGTGRESALEVPTYGKTGTTQDSRDALFVGFANGLVCGVWVGNDDNTPNEGLHGGGIPARVWRDFMQQALGVGAKQVPVAEPDNVVDPDADNVVEEPDAPDAQGLEGEFNGFGMNVRVNRDGSIELNRGDRERAQAIEDENGDEEDDRRRDRRREERFTPGRESITTDED
ncbi:transglycosylase domain-containing protein [Sphingomonas aracearum]|uniref:PBP1A family penicillin-binding protein n=1 Tax=Sphingomonas aracearum TaxID=2283317 RepID=A0A369W1N1_9SPHN|nr:PBP1A family penicillin-binding protein [Sphingomonas aracearum]RDE07182.1 PBP1A family penicillin-binding protein [Sphingomonas aracearum]